MSPSATEVGEVLARWHAAAHATGPGDRDEASRAMRELYLTAGLPAPERLVWLASPLEGAIAAYLIALEARAVTGAVRALLSAPVQAQLARALPGVDRDALGEGFWRSVRQLVRDEIGSAAYRRAGQRVFDRLRAEGVLAGASTPPPWDLVWPHVVSQTLRCGYGQQEAGAVALVELARRLRVPAASSAANALAALARACGWWWAFPRVAVLTDRPVALALDARGRLHAEMTPALEYADRFGVFAVDGAGVSSGVVRERNRARVAALVSERNAEVRRVMLEQIGVERLVRLGFARPIDVEPTRALYEIAVTGSPSLTVVQVTCPSTGRVYLLGVPPRMRRCHDAVAWTFGLSPGEYAPLQET